jgi:hypothetical protein
LTAAATAVPSKNGSMPSCSRRDPSPDVTLEGEADSGWCRFQRAAITGQALEQLTYLALERHPGWEINDGACGELVIDVAEATFVLDCSLRFTATDDHSTEL